MTTSAIEGDDDGEEDDEEGGDVSPDVGDTRGGCNRVILWDQALAREGIKDSAVGLQGTISSTDYRSWHREGIRDIEPEDVQAVLKFLIQGLAAGSILIEEQRVGFRVEEIA